MIYEFTISEVALDDMADIFSFYAYQSGDAFGQRVVDEMFNMIQELCVFSEMGVRRDRLRYGLRKIGVRQHLIFYTFENDFVRVQRILHGKRDLERLLKS